MQKIYVSSWLGIDFDSLPIELSSRRIADSHFYEAFYEKFFSEVHSYKEIKDLAYIPRKQAILNHLIQLTQKEKKILSIGCGLGYLEYELSRKNNSLDIVAIDPGSASVFLQNTNIHVLKGFFPEVLNSNLNSFDFVFASSIDYAFTDTQYENFLKSVVKFGIKKFLLTEIYLPQTDLISKIKLLLKETLITLGVFKSGQFWGYNRTLDEHVIILKRAGFNSFELGNYDHSYWINAKV